MKSFLCTIIAICSYGLSLGQFTDCKEYGLEGPVQRVHTKVYKNLQQNASGQWELDEELIAYSMVFEVDSLGNFTKIHIEYPSELSEQNFVSYQFFFAEGKKIRHVGVDSKGNCIDSALYTWLDDRTYIQKTYLGQYFLRETKNTLNEAYRDFRSETLAYKKENSQYRLMYIEGYRHQFDDKGRIRETHIINLTEGTQKTQLIEHLRFDEYGNALSMVVTLEDGTLVNYYERSYEYR